MNSEKLYISCITQIIIIFQTDCIRYFKDYNNARIAFSIDFKACENLNLSQAIYPIAFDQRVVF